MIQIESEWKGSIKDAWISTYIGYKINVFCPKEEDIDILDIAHALSMCTRFNGHLKKYYSVAEHSVQMSYIVRPKYALAALLHDAAEAYLSDVPRPIKKFIPKWNEIDNNLSSIILNKFGVIEIPKEIRHIDRAMCLAEADDSGHDTVSRGENHDIYGKLDYRPQYWDWKKAKTEFLKRFKDIYIPKELM